LITKIYPITAADNVKRDITIIGMINILESFWTPDIAFIANTTKMM